MDITLENLDQNVPNIIENIKNSLFLSFDFEFSGLNPHGAPKVNLHDTIQDRYYRAVNSAQNFLPIQFGLTTISFDNNQYKTNTFNFYLFARKSTRKFLSESASIDFLVQNKFDFNKLFKSGINFISKKEEERINPKLVQSASGNQNQNQSPQQPLSQIVISKPEDVKFLDDSLNTIKQWLEQEEGVGELELPPCNTFFVRILYQEIPKKYPTLFLKSSFAPHNKRIMKLSKVEVKQERSSFGSIINQIIESQKPLVGHNLLLDLCHFYHSFLAPLPLSVEEFSQELLKYFPKIIDTKYISEKFRDKVEAANTSLFDLYSFFSKSENFPSFLISPYEAELENPHEAGFDSYCAAFIFIKYCNLILNDNQINFHSPSLMQFHNKIFLPKSDVFLNLAFCRGSQINCKSSSIFYLYNFDPKVQTGTIGNWFSEFGPLKIEWKSDSSAFIIFDDESITKDVINSKYGNDSKFIIQTHSEYQQSLLSSSSEDTKKRKFPSENFEQNKRRRFENNNNGNFNNIINNNNKVATEDNQIMKEESRDIASDNNQDTKPKRPKKKKKVVEEEENMLSSSLCTIS